MNIKIQTTKIFLITVAFLFATLIAEAAENTDAFDDFKTINLTPIQILGTKETNLFENIPSAKTIITNTEIEAKQIQNIRNLSAVVPNLFVPDYGSKMSNAIYIRGVGSRQSGQTVGVYVDNVPLLDKTNFNFDFFDIQQIEILRGTQATLYGRNSMSGIINIYTLSPFAFQGTKFEIGAGSYGSRVFKASHYHLFNDKMGISVGGYFNQGDGYFTNIFNESKADDWKNFGGRIKFDVLLSEKIISQTSINFENAKQNAFPYGFYDETTQTQHAVNLNDDSKYKQNIFSISQIFDFDFDFFTVKAISSFQYLNDEMLMDQDFTAEPIFTLKQIQKRNSFSEEIIFKSKNNNKNHKNYHWSFGLFGFYDDLEPTADVLFKRNGITNLIENNITSNLPNFVQYSIIDSNFLIKNVFENQTFGAAIYHQSTYQNFLVDDLTLTAGIRFDYEKNKLHYNTHTSLTQAYTVQQGPSDTMQPFLNFFAPAEKDFFQILPKFALNYSLSPTVRFYSSASRGYKSGGFNIQMISDLAQNDLRANMVDDIKNSISNSEMPEHIKNNILANIPNVKRIDTAEGVIGKMLWYNPEYCWSFEFGSYLNFFDNKLNASISLFYMNLNDIQLTKFSPNGFGRMLSNAGSVASKGFEFSLNSKVFSNFSILFDYGFSDATFRNYKDTVSIFNHELNKNENIEIDYFAKKVPYAPQHTVSISGQYSKNISNFFVKNISVNLQYLGAGDIFWNEANNLSQNFYNVLNGKIIFALKKFNFSNKISIELWANNITNTKYQAFYFETLGRKFFQMNKPFHFGASLKVEL